MICPKIRSQIEYQSKMIKEKIKIICIDNPVHKKNARCLNDTCIDIPSSSDLLIYKTKKEIIFGKCVNYKKFCIKIQGLRYPSNNDTTMTMTTTHTCHLQ